jgi:hypothetical protein
MITKMIRTIIKANKQKLSFQVPANYIGKEIEVIVFPVEEANEMTFSQDKIETYLASESVLAKDWLTTQEDIAWKDL